jgi:hypothetical protein
LVARRKGPRDPAAPACAAGWAARWVAAISATIAASKQALSANPARCRVGG